MNAMKISYSKNVVRIMAILAIIFLNSFVNAQTLVVPPSPGDLSSVAHIKQSDDYIVEIKKSGDTEYTTCFVYKSYNYASNIWGSEHRPQKSASFTNFSFSGTSVDVKITTKFLAHSITVRPLNYNIVPTKAANVFTLTLTKPQKISVEINDRLNPLFILADAPDLPNTKATYYYGAGFIKWECTSRLSTSVNNIVFENINAIGAESVRELIVIDHHHKRPISAENITFKNIRVEAHPFYDGYMTGKFIAFRSR